MPKRNTNGPGGGRKASNTGKPFKKTGKRDSERPSSGKNFSKSSSRSSASKRSGTSDGESAGKGFFSRKSSPAPRGAGKPNREERPFRKNSREDGDARPARRTGSTRFNDGGEKPFKRSTRTNEGEEKSFKRPARGAGSSRFNEGEGKSFKQSSRGTGSARFNEGKDKPFKQSSRGTGSSRFNEGGDKPFKRPSRGAGSSRANEGEEKSFKRPARGAGFSRTNEGEEKSFKRPARGAGSARANEGEDKPFKRPARGASAARFNDRDDKSTKRPTRRASSDNDFDFSDEKSSGTKHDSERGSTSRESSRAGSRPRSRKSTTEEPATGDDKIRLNRFIANSGVCSRREADELISMGLISVNGKNITELGYKVSRTDEVRYENKVLRAEKPVYILMNKPKGFLTTTVDPQERNTVMHIIGNSVKERVYPVGRLDRNTTGLLLLTNDGDLADKLMHPSYKAKKIYKVELDRPLTRADFLQITEGIQLEEGKARVDDLAIISEDNKTVGVELHIGWNRVVRRIFESLGYEVVKLDRSVYAGLDKKDLPRGHWRFLKQEEIIRLKHLQ